MRVHGLDSGQSLGMSSCRRSVEFRPANDLPARITLQVNGEYETNCYARRCKTDLRNCPGRFEDPEENLVDQISTKRFQENGWGEGELVLQGLVGILDFGRGKGKRTYDSDCGDKTPRALMSAPSLLNRPVWTSPLDPGVQSTG
ncbi:hypothetical protein RRG08_014651 [Elysia crispata]|uniref:Uncharacterized protein n=1 Tax=Elysia crispata TaxID=231223 RepID=A0AAE1CYZ7_9GAST|nr:hypothetical protein RRG08_014651 [Elysia crispata]